MNAYKIKFQHAPNNAVPPAKYAVVNYMTMAEALEHAAEMATEGHDSPHCVIVTFVGPVANG